MYARWWILSMGHPRTYGATLRHEHQQHVAVGSSPHLRGNHFGAYRPTGPERVIPAPTGQPCPSVCGTPMTPGHPRTYGATGSRQVVVYRGGGSSPHLRGNLTSAHLFCEWRRVIPAPTGQPHCNAEILDGPKGHPRTYGATHRWTAGPARLEGSSPHLRGNHRLPLGGDDVERVIPAPTGQP